LFPGSSPAFCEHAHADVVNFDGLTALHGHCLN